METIVFEQKRGKALIAGILLLILGFWLGVVCVITINASFDTERFKGRDEPPFILISSIFGICMIPCVFYGIRGIKRAFATPPLRLDSDGFTDDSLGVGSVAWRDIDSLTFLDQTVYVNGYPNKIYAIAVILKDASKYPQKLSKIDKFMTKSMVQGVDLEIQLSGLKAYPDDVYAEFIRFHSQFG